MIDGLGDDLREDLVLVGHSPGAAWWSRSWQPTRRCGSASTWRPSGARGQALLDLVGHGPPPERTHPATSLVCTQDRAISVELQETIARRADQVLRSDTAHCPMLSAPEELAAVLDRAMDTGRTLAPSG